MEAFKILSQPMRIRILIIISCLLIATNQALKQEVHSTSLYQTDPWKYSKIKYGGVERSSFERHGKASLWPMVRVYEKIALNGSEVRLVCPHIAIKASKARSFKTVQLKQIQQGNIARQQFADGRTKRHEARLLDSNTAPTLTPQNHHEQVRWFRNHVPLQDSPYEHKMMKFNRPPPDESQTSKDDDSLSLRDRSMKLERYGEGSYGLSENNHNVYATAAHRRRKLNATTYQPAFASTDINGETASHSQQSFRGATKNDDAINTPNPNMRSLDSKPYDESPWFVNDFGELVLKKIDSNSAGSYTCLHGGQLSEVLIDVMLSDNSSHSSTQPANLLKSVPDGALGAAKLNTQTMPSGLLSPAGLTGLEKKVSHSTQEDRTGQFEDGQFGPPVTSVDVRPHLNKICSPASNASCDSGSDRKESDSVEGTTDDGRQMSELKMDRSRHLGFATTTKVKRDKNLANSKQSSMTFSPEDSLDNTNHEAIGGGPKNSVMSGHTAGLMVDLFEKAPLNSASSSSDWTHPANGYSAHLPPRLHLIESEIVSSHDLEFIPGLMYTKQQFYCPLMGHSDLQRAIENQINLLIGNFCRPLRADEVRDGQYRACAKLVKRLLAQLIEINKGCTSNNENALNEPELSHNSNLSCHGLHRMEKFVEIAWFKDGSELEFGSDGRGLDKGLNVKLIDLIYQLEVHPHSPHSGASRVSTTTEQQIGMSSSKVKVPSLLSSRGPTGRQQRQSSNRLRRHQRYHGSILRPLRGLILEIDGIRQINAGRYACALRFNNSNLESSLRTLKRLKQSERHQVVSNGDGFVHKQCFYGKDDKSRHCDPGWIESHDVPETRGARDVAESGKARRYESKGKIIENELSLGKVSSTPNTKRAGSSFGLSVAESVRGVETRTREIMTLTNGSESRDASKRTSLIWNGKLPVHGIEHQINSEQVKILKSILNAMDSSSENALDYFKQTVSSSRPLFVQAFLLVVNEKPANSCSLWSTIREANDAYSRRKLTDFKRLKRNIMKPTTAGAHKRLSSDKLRLRNHAQRAPLENLNEPNRRHSIGEYPTRDDDDAEQRSDNALSGVAKIDGKLAASLSWLNGSAKSEAGRGHQERRAGDIENALQSSQSNGQHNALPPEKNASGHDVGAETDNTKEFSPNGEVQSSRHGDNGIRHLATNPSLSFYTQTNEPREFGHKRPARTIQRKSDKEPAFVKAAGQNRTFDRQSSTTVEHGQHTINGIGQDLYEHSSQTSGLDFGSVSLNENPFNYANERNLSPRSLEAGERASTLFASFDLHQNTFDRGKTIGDASFTPATETMSLAQRIPADELGMPPHLGEIVPEESRRGNVVQAPDSQQLAIRAAALDEYPSGALTNALHIESLRRTKRAVLIDNSDGRVNTLPKYVIDGNLETFEADDQVEAGDSDGVANEVSEPRTDAAGQSRLGSDQLGASKQFDPTDGDQTSSLSQSVGLQPFDRIWKREFVTEKSNIRMRQRMARRRRKFNNIPAARKPDSATKTVSTGRLDGDGFINFLRKQRPLHERRGVSRRSVGRPLDDQSGIGGPGARGADCQTHDNDDALSIGLASARQPHTSKAESGHKLQLSKSQQKRRSSRSDKSGSRGHPIAASDSSEGRLTAPDQHQGESPTASSETRSMATEAPDSTLPSGSSSNWPTDRGSIDGVSSPASVLAASRLPRDEIATLPGARDSLPPAANGRMPLTPSGDGTDDDKDDADDVVADSIRRDLMTSSIGGEDDENLLWTAGQYLYVHLRAFAASSIYGVQVDVEWSNANKRASEIDSDGAHNGGGSESGLKRTKRTKAAIDNYDYLERVRSASSRGVGAPTSDAGITRAPIATIELISGQDLHLQCTAQALGRLPEVNWYKRVTRIPDHISDLMRKKFALELAEGHFWPVASLGLLDNDGSSKEFIDNFVCSQSVTIFDNLLNQTFTVVNDFKLSEPKGQMRGLAAIAASRQTSEELDDRRHNLYACVVTADVRREYATLGVNVRHASNKLPQELSERIRARPIMPPNQRKVDLSPNRRISPQTVGGGFPEDVSNYDFLRQSQLLVPFDGAWIPIRKNGTYARMDNDLLIDANGAARYSINPVILILVIASLASLLIALVYFTVKSYRALIANQAESECIDCVKRQHLADEQHEIQGEQQRPSGQLMATIKMSRSYCGFSSTKLAYEHKLTRYHTEDTPLESDISFSPTSSKSSLVGLVNNSIPCNGSLYKAHLHHTDARLIYDEVPEAFLSDMISTEIKDNLDYTFSDPCEGNDSCCTGKRQSEDPLAAQADLWNGCNQN